jgi:hypothetical protein
MTDSFRSIEPCFLSSEKKGTGSIISIVGRCNPVDFRNTLEDTLNRLVLPELHLELGDIAGMISAQLEKAFSDQVRELEVYAEILQVSRAALQEARQNNLT